MNTEQKGIYEDEGIDLKELWRSFSNFKELIVIISALFGIFAYIYSLTITPTYQASALVVPAAARRAWEVGSKAAHRLGGRTAAAS